MLKKIIIILAVVVLISTAFPLSAGANLQERPITTEAEAVDRAVELFPDLLRGKEKQLEVSSEFSNWHMFWEAPNVTEGISWISIWLEPETGWLHSFGYNEARPKSKRVWISINQAKKISYEFACRYQLGKMASTLP